MAHLISRLLPSLLKKKKEEREKHVTKPTHAAVHLFQEIDPSR